MTERSSLRSNWVEFLVVLIVLVLPGVVAGFQQPYSPTRHEDLFSFWGFARELLRSMQFGCLGGLLLLRDPYDQSFRAPFSTYSSKISQVLAGIGLWFAYYLFFDFWTILASYWQMTAHPTDWMHPVTATESQLHLIFSLINGLSEEILRLYLLSQLLKLGAGWKGSIIVTAALIASYHVYQGPFIAVGFFLANIVINRMYAVNRSLLMLFVWHALSDFMHSTDLAGLQIVSAFFSAGLMALLSKLGLVQL